MRGLYYIVPDQRFPSEHPPESDPGQTPTASEETVLPSRILGLDVGSRTIGQAVSDPLGITAQGLETIRRKNKRTDFAALERTLRRFEVKEIVVGYPLRLSGAASSQTRAVIDFAEELRRKFGCTVHLWDERLTSVQANRLLREAELSIQRRAQAVDRMAAILILQSFLEARRGGFR